METNQGTAVEASLKRILELLQCPSASSFSISEKVEVAKAVAWIEDRKIRYLDVGDRQGLRVADEKWCQNFRKYLRVMECPHADAWKADPAPAQPPGGWVLSPPHLGALRWIFDRAVACEYEDNGSMYNASAAAVASQGAGENGEAKGEVPSGGSQTSADALKALCTALGVQPKPDWTTLDTLRVCLLQVRTKHGPLVEMCSQAPPTRARAQHLRDMEGKFPLGFSTNDHTVDLASRLLRMLYVSDLRDLQNDVNAILVVTQEFTANPKTNSALGKVGR